jgi:hypothetical protein
LKGFKESILENQSKIDLNQYNIDKLDEKIEDYMKDDMFVNSKNNYSLIY